MIDIIKKFVSWFGKNMQNTSEMLSEEKLERAIRLNEHYKNKNPVRFITAAKSLGLTQDMHDTSDLAVEVHEYQVNNDLVEDGILGPSTQKEILRDVWGKPEGDHCFIFDGRKIPVQDDLNVVNFNDSDGFDLKNSANKGWSERDSTPINLVVSHWDGMYTSQGCFNTLLDRGTGMHFSIDWDGTVYQFLDLKLKAWGQNHVNSRAIGIEISNPVEPHKNNRFDTGKREELQIEVYSSGNPKKKVLGFNKAQVRAHNMLVENLCRAFKIPKQLPGWDPEVDKGEKPEDGVSRGVMPGGQKSNSVRRQGEFRGVCGHYHVTYTKQDPGTQLWQPIRDRGFGII